MADTIPGNLDSTSTLNVNSSTVSAIDSWGDTDWWKVTLTAGIQYQFDLIGSADDGLFSGSTLIDPYLILRDGTGTILSINDDSGLGLNSRIIYTPSVSGTYYLDARESGANATGSYRLAVNASPATGTLTLGASQSGYIDFSGDVDLFGVSLTAGVAYGFSVDGTTLVDPYLEVLNSTVVTQAFDDDSGVANSAFCMFTPTASGTYYLAARESGNNATGGYSVRVWQLPTVSINDAGIVEGDGGTVNLSFTVSLSAASPVPVTVTASTSETATATSSDYIPTSATISFAVGQTSASFTVQVRGDSSFEPTESFHVRLSNPASAVLGDSDAYGIIADNDNPYSLPADPYVGLQWYLYPTTGINVFPVWNDYTGAGIRVAVFDLGIDPAHPDLDGNVLTSLGRNASDLSVGGAPVLSTDNHGTMVAGTIAAERDGSGIVGVAYGASLVSIYNRLTSAEIPGAFTYAANFDVLNNSWGFGPNGLPYSSNHWAFLDNFQTAAFADAGTALANLAATGRNGLGTVVVQSAGNSFNYGDDTNLHNFQNSQYIVTVAATDYFGNATRYSSPGASILVAAPGGDRTADLMSGFWTTDRVGAAGTEAVDYTSTQGTSFSAPLVSGIVALMLQANRNLGYRDVQEVLAYSARETGSTATSWRYNGATNWNGGGLHYDALTHDLGFGLVDAHAAVRLAESWTGTPHTAANRQQVSLSHSPTNGAIPDNANLVTDVITVTDAIDIERVEVTLNVTHPFVGDLEVLLTSPSGTTSFLLWRPQQNALSPYGTNQNNIHFTFDTVLNWGDSSLGTWGLSIFDKAPGYVGTFDSWTLNLIGKPVSNDDCYIYTDEFSEACADQVARATLSDTGGTDTLNASAVSSNVILSLTSGSVSTIDGTNLAIAANTEIENAYGGDGNDLVTGNGIANLLYGMRGNDNISGGSGNDTLYGGTGNDTLMGDTGSDILFGNTGNDTLFGNLDNDTLYGGQGTDTLYGGQGADILYGNMADDFIYGNMADDIMYGGQGNDYMHGGAGNDQLLGNLDNDTLVGGIGNDTLTGGGGADTFVFGAAQGMDIITDFLLLDSDHISIAIGTNGITTTADALAHLGSDMYGNAVLDLGSGNTVTIVGVAPTSLAASDFTLA